MTATQALLKLLEQRFAPPHLCTGDDITGIIALGGADGRMREAGRLARAFPNARVVISDGIEPARLMRLLGPGIDPSRIIIEASSLTTYENAQFTAALVPHAEGERWLLVTSAVHMPRAMGAFRQARFDVEPWPVYDLTARDRHALAAIRHEWLGLANYWALGKGDALFPAPASRQSTVRLSGLDGAACAAYRLAAGPSPGSRDEKS